MELLRSCTKPSIYFFFTFSRRTFLLFLNLKLENYSVFTFLLFLDLKLEYYSVFTFLLFLDLQDCSNSSELAMGLLQSCTKPSISFFFHFFPTYFFTFSQPQNLDEGETYRYLGGGETQPGWKWGTTRKGLRCKSRGFGWSWDWTLVDLMCTPRELTEYDMWFGWRWDGTGIAII